MPIRLISGFTATLYGDPHDLPMCRHRHIAVDRLPDPSI
jgi:hypothetical protein